MWCTFITWASCVLQKQFNRDVQYGVVFKRLSVHTVHTQISYWQDVPTSNIQARMWILVHSTQHGCYVFCPSTNMIPNTVCTLGLILITTQLMKHKHFYLQLFGQRPPPEMHFCFWWPSGPSHHSFFWITACLAVWQNKHCRFCGWPADRPGSLGKAWILALSF